MTKRVSAEPGKIRISLLKPESKPTIVNPSNTSMIEEPPISKQIERLSLEEYGSDPHQYDL